ncbi:MAG TPA: hypothetical protein P5280_16455, partial [Cyclobacteriaceae bacterium]|nr:hypothetical protein [Cyclobacteriaceae bacterium]
MDVAELRRLITEHFSIEELRTLCLDLGIDDESVFADGKNKETWVRELIKRIKREKRLDELISHLQNRRPNVIWPKLSLPDTPPNKPVVKNSKPVFSRFLMVIAIVVAVGWFGFPYLRNILPIATPIPTPTHVPTQAPTHAPTQAPTLIPIINWSHQETFSSANGWDELSEHIGAVGYENGKYFVQIQDDNVFYIGLWGDAGRVNNGTLQVEVLGPFDDGGLKEQGIVFGWTQDLDGNTYGFTFDNVGNCRFWKENNGKWLGQSRGKAPSFGQTLEKHLVTVVLKDNYAFGYIDGTFCASESLPS